MQNEIETEQAEITSYDVERDDEASGGDGGDAYRIRCPECHESILCAQSGWWDTKCRCGYKWDFEIKGIGRKY